MTGPLHVSCPARRNAPRVVRLMLLPVLAAAAGCSASQPPPAAKVPVSVARAERRAVPFAIKATGSVEPIATVEVTAQVGGLLQHVRFHEGDEVREGQILFEIDPRPYEAALQQTQANLSRDLAQLSNAQREAERAHALLGSGLGTAEDAQSKQATHDALAATVRADSAALSASRLNLEYATVRAPIQGRTGSLLVKEGNLVRTSGPQALVTINEIRPIQVRFAVPATYLTDLQKRGNESLRVQVRQGGRDDAPPIEGVLSFFDNHVDSATGTVLLKARFPNANGTLWPGEFVDVTLVLGVQEGATVVPAQAVMTGQQGSFVFTVEADGTAKQRPVVVSRTADSLAVIASGLEVGTTVVTDGQLRLTQNARVEVKGDVTSSLGASAPAAGTARPAAGAAPPAAGAAKRAAP
jgi:multidrug efflux system membrane fusion protein